VEHYVTIFDSGFMPQGLALHSSLIKHAGPFRLWVICVDDLAKEYLDQRALEGIKTISLKDMETPDLLKVKVDRSRAEYCWTLTPFSPKFVFDLDSSVSRVTYLDADLFLLKNPQPIFTEFDQSQKSVLITDHAYDPEYDHSASSGQYCVQFMTFRRNESGERVRQWWQDRCIEWCYARSEDGKFGDQKYLDSWPDLFENEVHVLNRLDAILAPWNAKRFPYSSAIAWHFHGLRILKNDQYLLHSQYDVPDTVERYIYLQYVEILSNIKRGLPFSVEQGARPGKFIQAIKGLRDIALNAKKVYSASAKVINH
jgi:hypothetical protein